MRTSHMAPGEDRDAGPEEQEREARHPWQGPDFRPAEGILYSSRAAYRRGKPDRRDEKA
jgi:hypothetical protein